MNKRGFTLLELIIVIVILGILAAVGIPTYQKAIETGKANDAAALVSMAGTANKMFQLDHGGYASGLLNSACNTCSGNCSGDWNGCSGNGTPSCNGWSGAPPYNIVACRYLSPQNWDNKPYKLWMVYGDTLAGSCSQGTYTAGSAGSPAMVAAVCRNSVSAAYKTWGYAVDVNGTITVLGGAPAVP